MPANACRHALAGKVGHRKRKLEAARPKPESLLGAVGPGPGIRRVGVGEYGRVSAGSLYLPDARPPMTVDRMRLRGKVRVELYVPAVPIKPSIGDASRKRNHRKGGGVGGPDAFRWTQQVATVVPEMRDGTAKLGREAQFKTFEFEEDHAGSVLLAGRPLAPERRVS